MASIKKYQTGGSPKPVIKAAVKPAVKAIKKSLTPEKREAGMIEQLKKKGPMPASQKNVGRKGLKVKKAKSGSSFPDLNKDGKITKADILKGRGVIKKGGTIKKAKMGCASCGKSMKKKK